MQQVLVPWAEMKLDGIEVGGLGSGGISLNAEGQNVEGPFRMWRGVPQKLEAFRVGKRSFEFPHCSDGVVQPDGRLELVEFSCTEAELLRGITGPYPIRDLKQDEVLIKHPLGGFRVVRMMIAEPSDAAPVADRETLVEIRDNVRAIVGMMRGGSTTNAPGAPLGSKLRT